jgi:hypothetical protein
MKDLKKWKEHCLAAEWNHLFCNCMFLVHTVHMGGFAALYVKSNMATRLGIGWPRNLGSILRSGKRCFASVTFRLAIDPTEPSTQCVLGLFPLA